ncbi:MAG: phosphoribosylglycinamide formyltransferase [Deltaproteobacteria bacterium]|nr:phosphoribosylglycinamide formyltransferase [Deltaproteobacteria bacterium]MBI2974225.1 phosphoribosylglycinamide formyltransferase [Deltaproteobacteria bacterium]
MNSSAHKFPIAVLVSGNGSNLQAIIGAIESGRLDAEIRVAISSSSSAYALERCKKHGINSAVHDQKAYASKEEFETAIVQTIIESGAKLICLAGFMKVLSDAFVNKFSGFIMNIHPSLLPSFKGLHAQRQALEYGAKVSGCTIHFVNENLDGGPIILQVPVPILPDDTEETLSSRILREEHKLYPAAIQLFARGKLKIEGRKVLIS